MAQGQLYPVSVSASGVQISAYDSGREFVNNISALMPELDGNMMVPASNGTFLYDAGTITQIRSLAGVYGLQRAAGAGTTNFVLLLSDLMFQKIGKDPANNPVGPEYPAGSTIYSASSAPGGGKPHWIRGMQLTAFDVMYGISGAGITSITPVAYETTFANNVAPSVNLTPGGAITGTFPVATQAQPYLARGTFTTPYTPGGNNPDVGSYLELAVICPGTAVFTLYGVNLYFNYAIL